MCRAFRSTFGSLVWRSRTSWRAGARRCLYASALRSDITKLAMPAMSPTMTEGGIAQWKKKEGDSFTAGDVLLEVETDKATIDVEAQDDGILGKIIAHDGAKNIPVGQLIALLAEEGDDISNLEVPKEETSASSSKSEENLKGKDFQRITQPVQPSPALSTHDIHINHSRPLFPSVLRLLLVNNIENADQIKGTGVRGMLTKGDVLAFLGKASSPLGTFKEVKAELPEVKRKEEVKTLTGSAIRQLIVTDLLQTSARTYSHPPDDSYNFDSVLADYLPALTARKTTLHIPPLSKQTSTNAGYFDGLI